MLTGVEEGFKIGGVELQLGYFRALRARVVSSAVWFVADMLKLTIGATQVRQLKSRQMAACWRCLVRDERGVLEAVPKVSGEGVVVNDEKGRKGWTGFDRVGQPRVR